MAFFNLSEQMAMRVGVLGINYKSAEIGLQELLSRACRKRFSLASSIAEEYRCVVLSTCNRTEIYFSADNLAEAHSALLHVLREEIAVPFEHKLYSYFGCDCFLHLAHVTCGLDSTIIGESEIQRQVKVAYEHTLLHYSLPSCIHFLFQKSLKLGKHIRTHFSLGHNQVSIAKTLFQLGNHLLKDVAEMPVLFIGNSEVNRQVIDFFRRKGVRKLTLCTRSLHSAQEMAEKQNIALISWNELDMWRGFPLVICGSNAPHYLVHSPEEGMKTRLVFDLSMPRNVDPELARHPQLTLLNMEELNALMEKNQENSLIEVQQAEMLLLKNVQRHLESYRQKQTRAYACA